MAVSEPDGLLLAAVVDRSLIDAGTGIAVPHGIGKSRMVMTSDEMARGFLAPIGSAIVLLLLQKLKAKQAAARAKHGRGLIERACYGFGKIWARRSKPAQ